MSGPFAQSTFDLFAGEQKIAVQDDEQSIGLPQDQAAVYLRNLHLLYKSQSSLWRQQLEINWDYYLGAQLKAGLAAGIKNVRNVTVHTVNYIAPRVDTAISMLTSNSPRFTGTGREDSDTKTARMFADLMVYEWEKDNGQAKLKQVCKDYYIGSMGWMLTYFDEDADYGKGDVRYETVDARHVFVDPNAKDLFFDDAAHILIVKNLTYEQIIASYPQYKEILPSLSREYFNHRISTNLEGVDNQGSALAPQGSFADKYYVVDDYAKVKAAAVHVYEPLSGFEKVIESDGWEEDNIQERLKEYMESPVFLMKSAAMEKWIVDPKSIQDVRKFISQYTATAHAVQTADGQQGFFPGDETVEHPDGVMPVPGSTIQLREYVAEDAVRAGAIQVKDIYVDRIKRTFAIGWNVLYSRVLKIPHYPITPLINNFDRTVVPTADVARVRGLQEYLNNIRQLIVAHAALTTNFKIGYPRGGYDEKDLINKWRDRGNPFIPYDPELGGGLTPLGPAPLPNELYKNYEDAKNDIDAILGIYSVMDGNTQDAPNSYKGTVALDEYAQRRIKSKKEDVENFLNRLARNTIDLMQAYFSSYKAIRILRPNGNTEVLAINTGSQYDYDDVSAGADYALHDISVGSCDVVVVSGSMLPSNRFALAEYYKEMYKDGIIDREEVLMKTDIADTEGVLNRIGEIKQLQEMVNNLQQQLKQVSGDLQTANREAVTAGKQVEVIKFKGQLKEQEVQAKAATVLYQERMKDEVAKSAHEMRTERKITKKKKD